MSKIENILSKIEEVVNNPKKAVSDFKEDKKRPVIGCAPGYCPEEIIYAAGMLPIGMWGGKTNISKATMYFPAFACSLVQTTLENGLKGVYDELAGVIIPSHCDHLKCFGQDWKVAIPQVRLIPLVHPHNRNLKAGISFLKSEYVRIKETLEEIGANPISEAALNNAIEIYNANRKALREFTIVARSYSKTITPTIRHQIIKSRYFMDKAQHTILVNDLLNCLKDMPKEECTEKKVVLTGIITEPNEFLDIFTEYGLTVVADDLVHESRQFRVDVPPGHEPMERLAQYWSIMNSCSLVHDPNKKRRYLIRDLVQKSGADGVIACIMKFCEMEEFDYPIYKKTLEAENIPLLSLEVDLISPSLEQTRTRIQSFAEMLSYR